MKSYLPDGFEGEVLSDIFLSQKGLILTPQAQSYERNLQGTIVPRRDNFDKLQNGCQRHLSPCIEIQLKEPDISGAIFTLSLSILIQYKLY